MLTSLTLKNFRGFRDFKMPGLEQVNLITGKNNTGKTALLEAIYLCCGYKQNQNDLQQMFRTVAEPGGAEDFWNWSFYNREATSEADICAGLSDGRDQSVYLRHQQQRRSPTDQQFISIQGVNVFQKGIDGNQGYKPKLRVISFSTRPKQPTQDAVEYSTAAKKVDGEERIQNLLREIEPRLKKVRAFQIGNSANSLVYADIGLHDFIPVTQLGQGFNRLLNIYSSIVATSSQICLIDEIENGLHHSILPEVWKGLAALASQENVQIFATTHSWECAVTAHEVFRKQDPYGFALHRLERINGEIQSLTYDKETLDAVDALEMEVR